MRGAIPGSGLSAESGSRQLRYKVVLSTIVVSIIPLVVMAFVTFGQYTRSLESQTAQAISRMMISNKRSLESYLEERRSALAYIVRDRSSTELSNERVLSRMMRNLNASFASGSFVDLGLINRNGIQFAYHGPYRLKGQDYSSQDWFGHVSRRGMYTSDVFEGHRKSPHFVIAVRHESLTGGWHILRATIDAEMLGGQILRTGLGEADDVFLVNDDGVLQTGSRGFGEVLSSVPFEVPHPSDEVKSVHVANTKGRQLLASYTTIADSPFVLVFVRPEGHAAKGAMQLKLFAFLAVSVVLVLAVIMWGSAQFVRSIESENLRRAALIHRVEYTNKLASIGRIAAGVAHEINNPLAIINEKAGLLKDVVLGRGDFPEREKFQRMAESIMAAVERCTRITHRLLGFARRMDVHNEVVDVPAMIREVVDFVRKEADDRNIRVEVVSGEDVPTIESDRGQLQQVFLNLLNNALGAVKDGGQIRFTISWVSESRVRVEVEDNGVGIPQENLRRIFEPFFTTKEDGGTGLGLSITHGIVSKLGGELVVESEVGVGTKFTIFLPVRKG